MLCVFAAVGVMACSSQPSPAPDCADGGFCALLPPDFPPWTDGYMCVLPCECTPSADCSDPNVCPGAACPDAGSDRFCPQGWVCMPDVPCEIECTCGPNVPITYGCVSPG